MEITPTHDVYNQVLKRREIAFFTEHGIAATPKLYDVRKQLATRYSANEDLVFIRGLKTLTGTNRAVGEAEIYDSLEDALSLVPKYIVTRNMPERHKASKEENTKKG